MGNNNIHNNEDVPANRKHLYNMCTLLDQRRRRWFNIVQMLYNVSCLLRYVIIIFCEVKANSLMPLKGLFIKKTGKITHINHIL